MTDLPVLTSKLLDLPGVRHAFFTRQGGVSKGLYAGLNVGVGSNDDPASVAENRRRAAAQLGGELVTAYQVHSATALVADGPWPAGPPQADAVVTATPGVVCGALAADCAPILLADPQARVVAATHAGWKGALTGVAEAAVARMVALERKFVVAQADITTERRLQGSAGQARGLYAELMRNVATRAKPEGAAIANIVERWISDVDQEIRAGGGHSAQA